MNWVVTSAVADVIASIGVILSLLYLGRQIRSSGVIAKAESKRVQQGAVRETYLAVSQDPNLADLFVKGLANYTCLDAVEAIRFELLFTNFLESSMIVARDFELGIADEEDLETVRVLILRFLTTSGGEAWYMRNSSIAPKAFCRLVEQEIPNLEPKSSSVPNGI